MRQQKPPRSYDGAFTARRLGLLAHSRAAPVRDVRVVAEETAIALVYGGSTEAVMMATPADLEDFAVGFSITEGIVGHPNDIAELTVVPAADGIELRLWLTQHREAAYRGRRRRLAGPSGCGLCGVESLAAAMRPARRVGDGAAVGEGAVAAAVAALGRAQRLNQATHATHAAGFFLPDRGLVCVREDIGRHNALDKLAGALARAGQDGTDGLLAVTSRLSTEMVQKAAMIGAPVLVAISAPTTLAVHLADQANMTLVAVARGNSFEVFTHPKRIVPRARSRAGAKGRARSASAPSRRQAGLPLHAPAMGS